ncbi:unnamed protein product [Phytophthora fragariaefolia]|uniref:Unnamed protein product n=1 Tax=Phytophthora fragariaefolia TaxID=1490495 RepID=A0A9W7DAB9_9STRA|nr:unnamed protein product [Phytophthora fragariaefolia]
MKVHALVAATAAVHIVAFYVALENERKKFWSAIASTGSTTPSYFSTKDSFDICDLSRSTTSTQPGFLVHEEDRSLALIVGRPVMNRLGYSTDGLLAAARTRQPKYCLTEPGEGDPDKNNSPLVRVQAMRTRLLDELDVDGDDLDELVASPRLVAEAARAVQAALELTIQEARANGLTSKEGDCRGATHSSNLHISATCTNGYIQVGHM